MAFVADAPSMSGMDRSMITTSGLNRSASATASLPFVASAIAEMSLAGLNTALSPARTTAWSSASTTRITSPGMITLPFGSTRGRRRAICTPTRAERHAHTYRRPWRRSRGAGVDLELSVQQRDAFAHGEESHGSSVALDFRRIEPFSVVVNLHDRGAVSQPGAYLNGSRVAVAQGVRDGLARHAVQGSGDVARHLTQPGLGFGIHGHGDDGPVGRRARQMPERGDEPEVIKDLRMHGV